MLFLKVSLNETYPSKGRLSQKVHISRSGSYRHFVLKDLTYLCWSYVTLTSIQLIEVTGPSSGAEAGGEKGESICIDKESGL